MWSITGSWEKSARVRYPNVEQRFYADAGGNAFAVLARMLLHNLIAQPGKFAIMDTPIDLGAIHTPLYVLGAEGDHIAPWRSTYRAVNLVGGDDVTYTLTNSGHIAGIVNPPGNTKSKHWTKDRTSRTESADEWRASSHAVGEYW